MSFFSNFRNLFTAKEEAPEAVPAVDMSEVWKITDPRDMLAAVCERLNQKSHYGKYIDRLSPEEQVVYICDLLECEISNGGFDQFLYNSSGNYAHRTEECLRTIGAHKTADICKTAFAAYGKPIPQDRTKRQKFMEKMESDEISEILDECDNQFYAYPDKLAELCCQYILANKANFS